MSWYDEDMQEDWSNDFDDMDAGDWEDNMDGPSDRYFESQDYEMWG